MIEISKNNKHTPQIEKYIVSIFRERYTHEFLWKWSTYTHIDKVSIIVSTQSFEYIFLIWSYDLTPREWPISARTIGSISEWYPLPSLRSDTHYRHIELWRYRWEISWQCTSVCEPDNMNPLCISSIEAIHEEEWTHHITPSEITRPLQSSYHRTEMWPIVCKWSLHICLASIAHDSMCPRDTHHTIFYESPGSIETTDTMIFWYSWDILYCHRERGIHYPQCLILTCLCREIECIDESSYPYHDRECSDEISRVWEVCTRNRREEMNKD